MQNIENIPELLMLEMLSSIEGVKDSPNVDEKLKYSEIFLNLSKAMTHISEVMSIDEDAMTPDQNVLDNDDDDPFR